MAFNEKLPKWDNVGAEPPESKKTEGWQPTEKPPAQWFNWIFNRIYKTLEEIRTKAVEKETGKGLSTNDYTAIEKTKLSEIEDKANKTIINNTLTSTSTTQALSANQGKVLKDNLDEHKADIVTIVTDLEKKIGIVHNVESWKEVQDIVRGGRAENVFSVGDQLMANYNGIPTIWDVIGINHDTPTDVNMKHSMTIQTRDCLINAQFDAPEPNNPDANRKIYGNNRYIHSAIKQWLNSNENVFTWVSKHEHDAAPTGTPYAGAGFLKLLDPELTAVIGAVDKQAARNTITDAGGQDLFSDKVFLLSPVEVYSSVKGTTTGEKPYPFYSKLAGAPVHGYLPGRTKLLAGAPMTWWLRSPSVDHSYHTRTVYPEGSVYNTSASYAYGVSPACVII